MRLSTEVRYGIRALCALSILSHGGAPVPIARLAKQERLSPRYLSLIFHQLKGAGFVTTERGRRGGYRLAKRPEDISVAAVMRALEGPIAPVGCLLPPGEDEASRCPNKELCVSRPVWLQLQKDIERTLESITVASMVCSLPEAALQGYKDDAAR